MQKQVIVGLVLALCLVNTCSAIKCYSCMSTLDPRCASKVEDLTQLKQIDCEVAPRTASQTNYLPVTKCNKIVTEDRAGTIVSRGCHFEEYGDDMGKCASTSTLKVLECGICKGDLCNSASGYAAMGVVAMLSVVVGVLNL